MKLEVKSVKAKCGHDDYTSQTTASLYADGKLVGNTYNDGWGGTSNVTFKNDKAATEVYEWVKKNEEYPLGTVVDILINDYLKEKDLKKWTKKHVIFKLKSDPTGWYELKLRSLSTTERKRYADHIRKQHKDDVKELHDGTKWHNN